MSVKITCEKILRETVRNRVLRPAGIPEHRHGIRNGVFFRNQANCRGELRDPLPFTLRSGQSNLPSHSVPVEKEAIRSHFDLEILPQCQNPETKQLAWKGSAALCGTLQVIRNLWSGIRVLLLMQHFLVWPSDKRGAPVRLPAS